MRDEDDAADLGKSHYWRLLTAPSVDADRSSVLFLTGSDVTEESLSVGCADVLQMPLRQVPHAPRSKT
ncbi:MAG: hypothetical protein U0992_17680 [Planctomycetaceae bacterium]